MKKSLISSSYPLKKKIFDIVVIWVLGGILSSPIVAVLVALGVSLGLLAVGLCLVLIPASGTTLLYMKFVDKSKFDRY